jgi:hypothetical protein
MHNYQDISRLTAVAIWCVAAYMGLELLLALALLHDWSGLAGGGDYLADGGDPLFEGTSLLVAVPTFLALILCYVVVGRWIYRASVNAHAISDEMTISPGWAVGSYFIPILNLFRPFQAMREIWLASHLRGNWQPEPTPGLLVGWWALWIVTNILGNVSWRLDASMWEAATMIDIANAVLNVPLCLILIAIMRRIAAAQGTAGYDEVFA